MSDAPTRDPVLSARLPADFLRSRPKVDCHTGQSPICRQVDAALAVRSKWSMLHQPHARDIVRRCRMAVAFSLDLRGECAGAQPSAYQIKLKRNQGSVPSHSFLSGKINKGKTCRRHGIRRNRQRKHRKKPSRKRGRRSAQRSRVNPLAGQGDPARPGARFERLNRFFARAGLHSGTRYPLRSSMRWWILQPRSSVR